MRPTSADAPPLWVWIASVLAAAAVIGLSVPPFLAARAVSQAGDPTARLTEPIARFAEHDQVRPAPLRVIAFGDSALGTATLQGAEMNAYARDRGLELDYLRLWVPFCLLHQVLPAMNAALAAKPDLLIIETWSVVYKLDRHSAEIHRAFQADRSSERAGALQWIAAAPALVLEHQAYLFDRLSGGASEEPDALPEAREVAMVGARGRPGEKLRCDPASRRRMLRKVEARVRADAPLSVDPLLRQSLEALLERARVHGVRVVFVDIPRAQPIEAIPEVGAKREVTRELLRRYASEGRAEYLEISGSLADEDTCDYIHFTEVGRNRWLPWLVDRLASLRVQVPLPQGEVR